MLIDSLIRVAQKSRNKHEKIDLYYRISMLYNTIDPQQGLLYAQKAEQLNPDQDTQKINILNAYGVNYCRLSDYVKSIEFFNAAIEIAQKEDYKQIMAKLTGNLGVVYLELNRMESAQEYFQKALEKDSLLGNIVGINRHKLNLTTI